VLAEWVAQGAVVTVVAAAPVVTAADGAAWAVAGRLVVILARTAS